MNWYLSGCPVCGGDLHDDVEQPNWTTCVLCARSFKLKPADEPAALDSFRARSGRVRSAARAEIRPAAPLFVPGLRAS